MHKIVMENKRKITAEEVLTKIKDDGDFDQLRLKVIRKLKDDEELRNSIISMVKQSAALDRPGAESMKPRQLSDAIHQEIGNKVMGLISDGIWKILRSGDQMKTEITETVQSVCSELSNPRVKEDGESSSRSVLVPVHEGHHNNRGAAAPLKENRIKLSVGETNEPPGFCQLDRGYNNRKNHEDTEERVRMSMPCNGNARVEVGKESTTSPDALGPVKPHPGLTEAVKPMRSDDNVDDDDLDVPPGFG